MNSNIGSVLSVKIILPSETFLDTECNLLNIPAVEGVVGILPDHIPFVTDVSSGLVSIMNRDIQKEYYINGGIAQVDDQNQVTIITEYAITIADAKRTDINKKITELNKKISSYESNSIDYDIVAHNIQIYESLLKFL